MELIKQLLALDAIQRRLRHIDVAVLYEAAHLAVEEGQ